MLHLQNYFLKVFYYLLISNYESFHIFSRRFKNCYKCSRIFEAMTIAVQAFFAWHEEPKCGEYEQWDINSIIFSFQINDYPNWYVGAGIVMVKDYEKFWMFFLISNKQVISICFRIWSFLFFDLEISKWIFQDEKWRYNEICNFLLVPVLSRKSNY